MGCSSSSAKEQNCADDGGTNEEFPMLNPLFVRIEKANGLRDADSLDGGAADAFVVARIGLTGSSWASKFDDTAETQWRSSTKDNTADPTWNLAFSLDAVALELWTSASQVENPSWELQIRVYDKDILLDDYLGQVVAPIPSSREGQELVLPMSGADDVKGTVNVQLAFDDKPDWVTPALAPTAGVVNGQREAQDGFMSKMINKATVDSYMFMQCLADLTKDEKKEAIDPQNLTYIVDMAKLGLAKSYADILLPRSKDGGETVPDFPGPGSTTILSHAKVVEGLDSICLQLEEGNMTRTGPDGFLGLLRMNGAFWSKGPTRVEPPCIGLAVTLEQHTWIRPILESYMEMTMDDEKVQIIAQTCREWIDARHSTGEPFEVRAHVKQWSTKLLHRVLLGIELSDAEVVDFVAIQAKITVLSGFVPTGATWLAGKLLGLDKMIQFREKTMKSYSNVLKPKHPDLSATDLQLLVSAFLDAMLFAGGASLGLSVSCALATMYGGDASPLARSDIPEDKDDTFVQQLVWETIRYFPPVVGFPWVTPGSGTNDTGTQRTCLSLASAMKDPRVWGEDANEFKLRSVVDYHRLSVAFADMAVAKDGVKGGSRVCPAKTMALVAIGEFLKAWFAVEKNWEITPEEQAKIVFTGSPTQKPGGFVFKPV